MMKHLFRLSLLSLLLAAVALVGTRPTHSNTKTTQTNPSQLNRKRLAKLDRPLSYRSPGARHKIAIQKNDVETERALSTPSAAARIKRYSTFSLVELDYAQLAQLGPDQLARIQLRDDWNLIMLRRGQLDTAGPAPVIDPSLRQRSTSTRSLHLVQLFGPPTPATFDSITKTGAQVISYIPNNAYLLWATQAQIGQFRSLRQQGILQWEGPFHPAYKVDPHLDLNTVAELPIAISLADTPTTAQAIDQVKAIARKVVIPEFTSAGTIHLRVSAESFRLPDIARLAEVISIEPWAPFRLNDERANQISAGSLTLSTVSSVQVARPTSPGYLTFLASLGIHSDLDVAVDVGDTGLDIGSSDAARIHPDFLNADGVSRIAYMSDYTNDSHPADPTILPAHDTIGHGTINASIVGGFNNRSGSAFTDALGFQYGLGIAPFVKIGVSKLFQDNGAFTNINFGDVQGNAYRAGARVSSNSWGACEDQFCNLYSDDAAVVDSLTRDVDFLTAGDQGMVLVFASGNDGEDLAQSVSMPGTAKNVITVGASENFRTDGTDGCGVGASEADNALDIVAFSSGGPSQDGRAKPDCVAPGTHIQGAASQDQTFATQPTGNLGVCNRYFPAGQTLYTWSSGTSHSTPIVAGAAALAFNFLKNTLGTDPSPALVKAFLLNSASYITGKLGGDDLPGARQGWGLLDIGRMLDSSSRVLIEQAPERTFTESGGAPFQLTGVVDDPAKELRVMLAWTDPPGNSATNSPQVNELELEVTVGGVTYLGNVFSGQYSRIGGQPDFLNNVQGVRLPAGTTGPLVVRVRPVLIGGDGVPNSGGPLDQDFALVMTNAHEVAVPVLTIQTSNDLAAGVTVHHANGTNDAALIPGETPQISVTVNNESQTAGATVSSASLSITVGSTTTGQAGSFFSTIAAGGSATNATPFQFQIPGSLRCGATASLRLDLNTQNGPVQLSVPVQVGRPDNPSSSQLLFDDVDSASVKWKKKKGFDVSTAQAHSGSMSFHVQDAGLKDGDNRLASLTMKKNISVPANAGHVRLSFFHIFNFEPGYDGGVLEISTDFGETWHDAGAFVITGGYDGKVTDASKNPLGNRFAWTSRGKAGVFSQVVVNLDSFAGQTVKLRFLAGFDAATGILDGYTGWFIDDIRITTNLYSCR